MGSLLALASLALLALILWAAWTRSRARRALRDAGLVEGRVISVDAIQSRVELAGMEQAVLYSTRYGICGKPDRVIQTKRGPVPDEGVIDYIGRPVTIPFDDQLRAWILIFIREVQGAKRNHAIPTRSHNHRGKCRSCGFRNDCREAIR